MTYQLQAFKSDVLSVDVNDSINSMTLTTGSFGAPNGEQMLVIDYDVAGKAEIIRCSIDGTSITDMKRGQDGTPASTHSAGAKVIMAFVPSHYNFIASSIADGWIDANEDWIYSTATSITVPSGALEKYAVGDKIRLTQTTVKYFWVTAVADTAISVDGGADYILTNETINDNQYSHSNPVGFPYRWHYIGQTGEPEFQNGWTNYGGDWVPARFMKDQNGFVHLEGMIKSGIASSTMFVLPAGFRPSDLIPFVVLQRGGVTNNLNTGKVYADGRVFCEGGYDTSNLWLILNVVFRAEN